MPIQRPQPLIQPRPRRPLTLKEATALSYALMRAVSSQMSESSLCGGHTLFSAIARPRSRPHSRPAPPFPPARCRAGTPSRPPWPRARPHAPRTRRAPPPEGAWPFPGAWGGASAAAEGPGPTHRERRPGELRGGSRDRASDRRADELLLCSLLGSSIQERQGAAGKGHKDLGSGAFLL